MDDVALAIKNDVVILSDFPLSDSIYHSLKRAIITGRISTGTRINESLISQELHISRTPIRYALVLLEKEGLVERFPGFGMFVKGITINDAHEIYAIRKELDSLAFITAMQYMSEKDYQYAREILQDDHHNYPPSSSEKKNKQFFSDFNAFIYRKSELKRLPQLINNLQVYLSYFRQLCTNTPDRIDLSRHEHQKMLILMETGERESLKNVIHQHLNHSLENITWEMEKLKSEFGDFK